MLSPVLVVGVGGSGTKALRSIRQSLLRQLKRRGWQPKDSYGLPQAWQLVAIDSVTTMGSEGFSLAPPLPSSCYLGLVPPGADYRSVRLAMQQASPQSVQLPAFGNWLPETSLVPIALGAGQYRTIGRVIALATLPAIKAKLTSAVDLMSSAEALGELRVATRLLGGDDSAQTPPPMAIVVSSIAGGTGAGMFMDVGEALKTTHPSFHDLTHVFLFTPDVFGSLPEGMSKGVAPNALGALGALAGGVWGPRGEGTDEVFANAGLIGRTADRFGGNCTFLIGKGSGDVTLGTTADEIYLSAGDALAGLIGSEDLQDSFHKFTVINVFVNSANESLVADGTRLKIAGEVSHRQPLAALGFGRVSLGVERFLEYASKAVARSGVERLLWPQFEPQDPGVELTDGQRVSQRANVLWAEFVGGSGLNERNPANDVVDAFTPVGLLEGLAGEAQGYLSQVAAGVGNRGMPPGQWADQLGVVFGQRCGEVLVRQRGEVFAAGQRWCAQIAARVVDHVSQVAAAEGLAVAGELLSRLRDEVAFVRGEELPGEVRELEHYQLQTVSYIASALNVNVGAIPGNFPGLQDAVTQMRDGLWRLVHADVLRVVAGVLGDLDANVLGPLHQALVDARGVMLAAVTAVETVDGQVNRFGEWPVVAGTVVPKDLFPGPTEKVMISPREYPGLLGELVQASVEVEARANWVSRVVLRSLLGTALDERGDGQPTRLVEVVAGWVPVEPSLRTGALSPQGAKYRIAGDPPAYLEWVEDWLVDPQMAQTALGKFLGMSIPEYVGVADPVLRGEREQAFLRAFTEMLAASRPLVAVGAQLRPQVHPNVNDATEVNYGTIPFEEGSDMFQRCKQVMVNAGPGYWDDARSPKVFKSMPVSGVEVFTTAGRAMNPVVFDSLMKKIAQSWAGDNANHGTREGWWTNRRSMPLAQALPVAPAVLEWMVTGWFVLGLFGQRRITEGDKGKGPRVAVYSAEHRGWVEFPYPMLGVYSDKRVTDPIVLLPAVLESVLIALVRVNAEASLQPLHAYHALRDAGEDAAGRLQSWVLDGVLPDGAQPGEAVRALAGGAGTAEQRRDQVRTTVTTAQAHYEKMFAEVDQANNPFNVPPVWELRQQIRVGLSTLQRELTGINTETGGMGL